MDVDEALESLGKYGRWQLCYYCLFCTVMMLPACFQVLGIIFVGAVPPHHCKVEANVTLPFIERAGLLIPDECHMFLPNSTGNRTIPCVDGWEYEKDFGWTIVSEWDLVCSKNYLSEMTQTLFGCGMLVGTLAIPPVADWFGRKNTFLVCQVILAASSLAAAFTQNYYSFGICRVLQGLLGTGILTTGLVLACELFPAKRRTFAGVFVEFFWCGAMFALTFLGYMLRNWRHLQIALALIPSVSIAGFWICPESIPWLVANDRADDAERLLQKAAKINKLKLPEVILKNTVSNQHGGEGGKRGRRHLIEVACDGCCGRSERDDCAKLISHPRLRKYTIIAFTLWFVNSLVYFGLSFTSVTLTGNRFLNFFLNALVEFPAALLCVYFLQRHGRRLPLCVFHIFAGIFLIALVFVPFKAAPGQDLSWVIITLNMLGKMFISASFDTIFMFTPELYPTNLRNTGLGISAFARFGGMIAPFSTLVIRIISWLPGLVFGVLSVLVGLLALCLPETLGRPLPQTAEEIDGWEEEERCLSCCHGSAKNRQGQGRRNKTLSEGGAGISDTTGVI